MTNNLAPLRLRFLAYVTDMLINLFLFMTFVLIAASQKDLAHVVAIMFIYIALIGFNPLFYYQSVLFTHFYGGSLGKLLTGLRVTSETGTRLPFKRIFFRQTIGYMFAGLILGLGFWSISKEQKKQGWHDKAVGSLVIMEKPLWFVGVAACILYLILCSYFASNAYMKITTGPLLGQIQTVAQNLSAAFK